jgi:hypothetical protein
LASFLADARQFEAKNRSIISKTPLRLYFHKPTNFGQTVESYILVLFSLLSSSSLARLLCLPAEEVERKVEYLYETWNIQKSSTSLRDLQSFLLQNLQVKFGHTDLNLWPGTGEAHWSMARNCIQLMSTSLREDICGVGEPYKPINKVDLNQVQQCIPPEVRYACLNWIRHLQNSRARLRDGDEVHQFIQTHALHWVEVLCWIRELYHGIRAISALEQISGVS